MKKVDLKRIFIEEIYSKASVRNYPTTKIRYNHFDEIWSLDLIGNIDYKISNNKVYKYMFIIIDNFSKYFSATPLKNKNSQILTKEFSKILTTSNRSPCKIENDRGTELYNSIFQNFLKAKSIQHYSRFTDKDPSIAEKVIKTVRNLLKKPVFENGNANWISEFPSVIKHYIITIHSSVKTTPIQANKKANEKEVYSNIKGNREIRKSKFNLGQLVRTGDIKKCFGKGDSTNWSYNFCTTTEVILDTIPSYQINFFSERYN